MEVVLAKLLGMWQLKGKLKATNKKKNGYGSLVGQDREIQLM
jgi:hypothetical protein